MLLILLSWIYITFTSVNIGMLVDKILKLNIKDVAIIIILGLFGLTLFTGFWAIFFRVNREFHTILFLLNLTILIVGKHSVKNSYRQIWNNFKTLSPTLKALLGIITILIIAQCASSPYIIDNETYYIQSIKWINEYGFVKGLANLHPFLAQMSGWHVAQSAFSFSFLYDRYNDLSGFCLLMGNFFAVTKLNAYFKNGNKLYLAIGLLPITNVFLFQFISAPSPDLPVYIFTLIIVFYFIENYKVTSAEAFKLLVLLAIYCLYIKPTSVILLLFPLIYFIAHFKILKANILSVASMGCLILMAFIAKNSIISGYPLFPFTGIAIDADYTLPKEIADFYVDMTRRYAFRMNIGEFASISSWKLFIHWVSLPGLHGFFNKLAVAFALLSPAVIYKFYNRKAVWIVYGVMCVQLVFLYVASPQYRFFFNFTLVFSLLGGALILKRKSHSIAILAVCTLIAAFTIFLPLNLKYLTTNELMSHKGKFNLNNIINPAENSKWSSFKTLPPLGNMLFYYPANVPNWWITGDGPLPSVNPEQLEYFRRQYNVLPQLRGETIDDGFNSVKITQ
ncbi:MAG: LIC_10190 family membrane protein [Flavobacterium sp.]